MINDLNIILDEIWVHIRSLGNWTDKLNEYFSNFNLVLEMNKLYFSNEHDIGINLKNVSRINTKPKIEKKQSNFDRKNLIQLLWTYHKFMHKIEFLQIADPTLVSLSWKALLYLAENPKILKSKV